MTITPLEKALRFRQLHQQPGAFIMANAWDAGSARLLASLGYQALATSSSAHAGTLGRRDYQVTRDEALAHGKSIADATDLPVSADLEGGWGAAPQAAAQTIAMAAAAGLSGGSIEDSTGDPQAPLYPLAQAVERVAAAVEAARAQAVPFVLTARAEGFLHPDPDTDEIVERLQAFERAGADVLFAPGIPDLPTVRLICSAVSRPVNFMVAIPGKSFTVAQLQAAGVRRISLAASLYRAAMAGLAEAAREPLATGTFGYLERPAR